MISAFYIPELLIKNKKIECLLRQNLLRKIEMEQPMSANLSPQISYIDEILNIFIYMYNNIKIYFNIFIISYLNNLS